MGFPSVHFPFGKYRGLDEFGNTSAPDNRERINVLAALPGKKLFRRDKYERVAGSGDASSCKRLKSSGLVLPRPSAPFLVVVPRHCVSRYSGRKVSRGDKRL